MKRLLLLLVLALPLTADVTRGRTLATQQCASCHALAAAADPYQAILRDGPPLMHAGSKFRQEWLVAWLQAPRRIRPAGYLPFRFVTSTPDGDRIVEGLLPKHPSLSADDARDVAAYLGTLKREINPYPAAETHTVRGQLQFEKILGCAGCHQGSAKGGASAPELSSAAERLDDSWLNAYVFDTPYWAPTTMPKVAMRAEQLVAITEFLRATPSPSTPPPTAANGPRTTTPIAAERAAMLYQVYCTQCHGVRGNGKGINAPSLFVAPRDHTSAEEMGMLTDDRLFAAIKFGGTAVGKSSLMPSWNGTIADADIKLLVGHLRTLSGSAP